VHYVPEAQETLLHPLNNGEMLNAISIPVDVLAFLTRELVLPVENGALDNVDIIDIPVFEDHSADLLRQAKSSGCSSITVSSFSRMCWLSAMRQRSTNRRQKSKSVDELGQRDAAC
jgi:hypothetical protein